MTDDECLEGIRAGGRARDAGISTLYRRYAKQIVGYFVYRHRLPQGQAEDLAQDCFVRVVRKCDEFRGETRIDAWVWAIARNCLMDHFRRQRPEDLVSDEDLERLSDATQAAAPDDVENLDDCVQKAYAAFAEAFGERAHWLSLTVFQNWSTEDVAAALNRTAGATREYLSQCRKKLKPFLEPCREYMTD